jgi:hypothetical protein
MRLENGFGVPRPPRGPPGGAPQGAPPTHQHPVGGGWGATASSGVSGARVGRGGGGLGGG